jgi:hypothetical protein
MSILVRCFATVYKVLANLKVANPPACATLLTINPNLCATIGCNSYRGEVGNKSRLNGGGLVV